MRVKRLVAAAIAGLALSVAVPAAASYAAPGSDVEAPLNGIPIIGCDSGLGNLICSLAKAVVR